MAEEYGLDVELEDEGDDDINTPPEPSELDILKGERDDLVDAIEDADDVEAAAKAAHEAAVEYHDAVDEEYKSAETAYKTAETNFNIAKGIFDQWIIDNKFEDTEAAYLAAEKAYVKEVRDPYEAVRIETEAKTEAVNAAKQKLEEAGDDKEEAETDLAIAQEAFDEAWVAYISAREAYDAVATGLREIFETTGIALQDLLDALELTGTVKDEIESLKEAVLIMNYDHAAVIIDRLLKKD